MLLFYIKYITVYFLSKFKPIYAEHQATYLLLHSEFYQAMLCFLLAFFICMAGFDKLFCGFLILVVGWRWMVGLGARSSKLMRSALFCVVLLTAAVYAHSLHLFPNRGYLQRHASWLAHEQTVVVKVLAVVKLGAHYQKYIVDLQRVGAQVVNLHMALSCYGYWPVMRVGDSWRLQTRLYNPEKHSRYVPYKYWLALHHIDILGTILHGKSYYAQHTHAVHAFRFNDNRSHNKPSQMQSQSQSGFLASFCSKLSHDKFCLERLRQKVVLHVIKVIPHPELAAFIAALCVGSRVTVSSAQWHVLAATGTNHLIAVAGLHIGTLLLLSGLVLGRIKLTHQCYYYPHILYVLSICLLVALAYALLSGFALPARRTLLMYAGYVLATLQGRYIGFLQKWLWAMLVIVLCSPLEVYQASFWLSFTAVIIILQAARPSQVNWLEEEALQKLAYNLRFLVPTCSWGSLVWLREHLQYVWRIQWGLFIGLLPLALYFFQQASVWMIPANLIAVPWVAWVIMPLAWLACFSWLFSVSLSNTLFHLAASLLQPVWRVLCLFSSGGRLVYHHSLSGLLWVVLAMGLGFLYLCSTLDWRLRILLLIIWGLVCFIL